MSASDEKRLSKTQSAESMTQKQRLELAKSQKTKQNKTAYTVIGAVCAAATAALLIWNAWDSRGGVKTGAVAATVDGVDYKVPDLQYYYMAVKNNETSMAQMYASYGMTSSYDYDLDEGAQWYNEAEGKTYADHFREQALDNLKETSVLVKAAQDAGYILSDEGKKQIAEQFSQLDLLCAKNGLTRSAYFSRVYGHGVTEKVFTRNLTNDVLASEYADQHQEGIPIDDESMEDYYAEHQAELDSYDYRVFTISGAPETVPDEETALDDEAYSDGESDLGDEVYPDEEGNLDAEDSSSEPTEEEIAAAMAEAKAKADAAVAMVAASANKEAAFAEAAGTFAENTSDTLRTGTVGSSLASAYAAWLRDESRQAGDVTAVEDSDLYYVVLFLNSYRDETSTVDVRHILVNASTDGSTETDEDGNAIPTEEAMNEARTAAQAILDEYLAGDQTEDSFAALANEKSEDTGSNSNGGLYTSVAPGQMVPNFNSWIFDPARQPGDTGLVENIGHYSGVHVMYYVGTNDPSWKLSTLSALRSDAQSQWLDELQEAVVAEAKDGMRYVGSESTAEATPAEDAEAGTETDEQLAESLELETETDTQSAEGVESGTETDEQSSTSIASETEPDEPLTESAEE